MSWHPRLAAPAHVPALHWLVSSAPSRHPLALPASSLLPAPAAMPCCWCGACGQRLAGASPTHRSWGAEQQCCGAELLQDLQAYRKQVWEQSLRQAVLPPEVAATKSTTAAIELKQAGWVPGLSAQFAWPVVLGTCSACVPTVVCWLATTHNGCPCLPLAQAAPWRSRHAPWQRRRQPCFPRRQPLAGCGRHVGCGAWLHTAWPRPRRSSRGSRGAAAAAAGWRWAVQVACPRVPAPHPHR